MELRHPLALNISSIQGTKNNEVDESNKENSVFTAGGGSANNKHEGASC